MMYVSTSFVQGISNTTVIRVFVARDQGNNLLLLLLSQLTKVHMCRTDQFVQYYIPTVG